MDVILASSAFSAESVKSFRTLFSRPQPKPSAYANHGARSTPNVSSIPYLQDSYTSAWNIPINTNAPSETAPVTPNVAVASKGLDSDVPDAGGSDARLDTEDHGISKIPKLLDGDEKISQPRPLEGSLTSTTKKGRGSALRVLKAFGFVLLLLFCLLVGWVGWKIHQDPRVST